MDSWDRFDISSTSLDLTKQLPEERFDAVIRHNTFRCLTGASGMVFDISCLDTLVVNQRRQTRDSFGRSISYLDALEASVYIKLEPHAYKQIQLILSRRSHQMLLDR